jgi:hypothetical protein
MIYDEVDAKFSTKLRIKFEIKEENVGLISRVVIGRRTKSSPPPSLAHWGQP